MLVMQNHRQSGATSPLVGKWIGFKFVVYNIVTNDGKHAVKLEIGYMLTLTEKIGRKFMKEAILASGGDWRRM